MRNLRIHDRFRVKMNLGEMLSPEYEGAFKFQYKGKLLGVVASNSDGWDHVSVSTNDRCPTWDEMEHIKRCFFMDDETAMQLHVPASDHISYHPYCLHMWRPHDVEIPRPPQALVGAPPGWKP
jgi:hypothetical protein